MPAAYAALIALGLIWGSNFIYMKWAATFISPAQIVFLRVLFGFLPLALVAWQRGVIHRSQIRHLPHYLVISVMATSFYYYSFVVATAMLPSSVAGLLSGAIPIFTFLASLLFLRNEPPARRVGLGVALGFLGIVLSARPWEGGGEIPLAGVLWMLAGAASIGVSFVYTRKFLSPLGLPPLALATWQTGLAVPTLLLMTDLHGITAIAEEWRAALGMIIGLGVVGAGLAVLIYYFIIERLGPVRAAGSTYIAPVVAVLIGALAGEAVTVIEGLALAMILSGVVLIQTGHRKDQAPRQWPERSSSSPASQDITGA